MPSGNRAYNIPSMAIARAKAVARSLILQITTYLLLSNRFRDQIEELEQLRLWT
jgi:hypothetical protein